MVVIVLIQRFLLYFGNPIHAAAAVISGILVCSGIGSLLSVHWIRKIGHALYLGHPPADRDGNHEIPWAWGINGCLSVVNTVLATVIALELGFVRVMILAAFVYCMTFLAGWTGLLRPEAFRSIHPW